MSYFSYQETQPAALRYFSDVMWLVESEPRPQISPAFSTLFSSILKHPVIFKELPADVLYAMDVRGTVYVNVAFPHASTPCKVRRNLLRLLSVLYFHKAFYCSGAKYCGTLNRLDSIFLEDDRDFPPYPLRLKSGGLRRGLPKKPQGFSPSGVSNAIIWVEVITW